MRNRNLGIQRVKVSDLEDHPSNFRLHPAAQREALNGAVEELGYYGFPTTYVTPDGKYRLIDGHLRKELLAKYGPDHEVEVLVTDFDEAESRKALLIHDPLAAMAEANKTVLDELMKRTHFDDPAVKAMLDKMAEDAGIKPPEFHAVSFDAQGRLDQKAKTTCPSCGHEF